MPYHHGMEKLRHFCESGALSISDLARRLDVSPPTVTEWCRGRRPVPIARCLAIERATGGVVSRRDLRPNDWREIWPDLVDSDGNPTQTPGHQAAVAINSEARQQAQEVAHG